jgi:alpha-mannosidase
MDDKPEPWDAWDIERSAFDTAVDLAELETLEWVERSETRARLRVVRAFGSSRIEQELRLTRGSARLEVHCTVDWHETHKLLKVAFPLNVHAATARHEIQFGHVERPTHENTSWDRARFETCAHSWVDLSEDGFGVALLNDCKYGHDVRGNVLRLSLLKAPTWPDPLADRGPHRFTYALYPHAGPPTSGGVIAEAHALNAPLGVRAIEPGNEAERTLPARYSLLEPDDPGVVVAALKPADDGDGRIVRLYEAFGGRRHVRLRAPGTTRAERVDLLEEPLDGAPVAVADEEMELELRPFELVTLRLR